MTWTLGIVAGIGLLALVWLLADLRRHRRRLERWEQIERAQERAAAAATRPRSGNVSNLGPH